VQHCELLTKKGVRAKLNFTATILDLD
jgi:hypothetical protein